MDSWGSLFSGEFLVFLDLSSSKLSTSLFLGAAVLFVVVGARLVGFIHGRKLIYSVKKPQRRLSERNGPDRRISTLSRDVDSDRAKVQKRKECFLRRVGDDYGYVKTPGGFIDEWRIRELPQLIPPIGKTAPEPSSGEGEVYLDYAGSALVLKSQLKAIYSEHQVLANPHSTGPAAARTQRLVLQARQMILQHFDAAPGRLAGLKPARGESTRNASDADYHPGYDIVFTSGATEALRIVAERFPWKGETHCTDCGQLSTPSIFAYPQSAHTSVVGMRGPAMAGGTRFVCKPMEQLRRDLHEAEGDRDWTKTRSCPHCPARNLLVLPLECNFGGERIASPSNNALKEFREGLDCQWSIMLDVAKAASTGPVSLKTLNPDFACLSFYKVFGEPTGLGCLFVRRTAIPLLLSSTRNPYHYFGGGSVDVVLPTTDFAVHKSDNLASLSNGTIHFRGIAAIRHGFVELERVGGMACIRRHSVALARELVSRFCELRHCRTDEPVIVLYGGWARYWGGEKCVENEPGPTVAFNIVREDGSYVGYNEFSKLAALNRPPLQLRTGCFCNPGACQLSLGKSNEEIQRNYESAGHVCGDQIDIIDGKPTGAIRASFGKDSTWEDMDALVGFCGATLRTRFGRSNRIQSQLEWMSERGHCFRALPLSH